MDKHIQSLLDRLLNSPAGRWFGFLARPRKEAKLSLSRRAVTIAILGGAGAAAVAGVNPLAQGRTFNRKLIRPPGSLAEPEFLSKCVRCSACLKVCPTNALHSTLLEAGWEGMWTPRLVPQIGYCEYGCTLCGQVCPTAAIQRLVPEVKNKVKIGMAIVDRTRCLPWAYDRPCIVCEEHCPTPKKAIFFEEVDVVDRNGEMKHLQQPKVDLNLCIGCGICEKVCPIKSGPAIYVESTGEDRNSDNQAVLSGYG